MPATTPYRRPGGNRRPNISNTARRPAVPERSAPCTIVSSYWSVSRAVESVTQVSLGRVEAWST